MSDISVTATTVLKGASGPTILNGVFGETVTAGMSVYQKASDGKYYKAQCDGTVEESGFGVNVGVALNGGAVNQEARIQTLGTYTAGATLVIGETYVVAATAGGIAPVADLVATNKVTILGVATSASLLQLAPLATGVAHG